MLEEARMMLPKVTSGSEPLRLFLHSSHRALDSGVFKWQPELIRSATVAVDKSTDAVAQFLRHLQLLPVDPDVLQDNISWNVSQVDAKHLLVKDGV